MKIGVALSGCDIGGVGAYEVLRRLEEHGFTIGMLSVCGLPSMTALLYALGCEKQGIRRHAESFLQSARGVDIDMAVAEFAAELPLRRKKSRFPTVVSSVNVPDGQICAFTGDNTLSTTRLRTFPLEDAYDVLSATISPVEGLASYSYAGCQLCDFSVWYGAPVYPLKMAGLDKIVSVAFLPQCPTTPYEALVKQRITASAHLADIHIPIELDRQDKLEQYIETASTGLESHMENICTKVLF